MRDHTQVRWSRASRLGCLVGRGRAFLFRGKSPIAVKVRGHANIQGNLPIFRAALVQTGPLLPCSTLTAIPPGPRAFAPRRLENSGAASSKQNRRPFPFLTLGDFYYVDSCCYRRGHYHRC